MPVCNTDDLLLQAIAHFSLDTIREFIKSGFADPQQGWNAETQRQYNLARDHCGMLARRFVREGISCIIDDAFFPEWDAVNYNGWCAALDGVEHHVVVILPRLNRLMERNWRRRSQRRLTDQDIETIYSMMEPWGNQDRFPVVDNSDLTVSETVAIISAEITKIRSSTH